MEKDEINRDELIVHNKISCMKKTVSFLLSIAFVLIVSQVVAQSLLPKTDTASIAGNWVLVPVLTSDTVTGKIPSIYFNVKGTRFTGYTGCNKMSGRFTIDGRKLSFSQQLMITKMECQGYNEKQFIVNLLRVTNYKLENGILILMYGSTPLSKWMRKAERNVL